MSELRKVSLLLLGILICTSPAMAQSGSRVGSGLIRRRILQQQGLTRAWWSQAVMNYRRDKLQHLTNDDKNVYVQSSNGILTTFDAESGRKKWATRIGSADAPGMPASSNDTHVFVWSAATLFMLDKESGKIVEQFDLPGQPSTSARADEEQIYIGFLDGSLYAFDIESGMVNWRYQTSKRILVPALPHSHTVLFASTNGILYSVDALTRDTVFQFESDSQITAPMAVFEDLVLLASEDYKLYALNINNGSQGWRSPFLSGERIKQAPVVIKNDVYLVPEHRGLYCLSAKTGDEHWYVEGIEKLLSLSPRRVYAVDRLNRLVILNRDTGAKVGGVPLGPATVHMTNDFTDRIYVATSSGTIVCLRETPRDLPHFHKNPEEQPLMPQFAPANAQAAAPAAEDATAADADAKPAP
ncbi:PQQ-binding-like beta-propeller repeat protein [Symmachiella dynata]|uniref:outer membrane protein assembly factor BamB family protein n=1 Tax=Symmachiella dynata TaxID=2527995 RepID=UPI0030ED3DCC